MERLAASSTDYEARDEGEAAEENDQVVIDFTGRIDGEVFEGGEAEDYPLVLGSESFIPGFEGQLVGTKAGEEKDVSVSFPQEYGAPNLAGKDAVFSVTVKEVRKPKPAEINDALAERYGSDTLDALREQLRERIGAEYTGAARTLLKRRLLDRLDELVSFDLPQSLVDIEANSIAHQLWHEEHPDEQGHDHAHVEPTDEHRKLAERRVKLGLLLADIGSREKVEISEAELGQAIMAQSRRYPGQEREFFDFVRQNREALEQIRAPVYEDKVVDLILGRAQVTDTPVEQGRAAVRDGRVGGRRAPGCGRHRRGGGRRGLTRPRRLGTVHIARRCRGRSQSATGGNPLKRPARRNAPSLVRSG